MACENQRYSNLGQADLLLKLGFLDLASNRSIVLGAKTKSLGHFAPAINARLRSRCSIIQLNPKYAAHNESKRPLHHPYSPTHPSLGGTRRGDSRPLGGSLRAGPHGCRFASFEKELIASLDIERCCGHSDAISLPDPPIPPRQNLRRNPQKIP